MYLILSNFIQWECVLSRFMDHKIVGPNRLSGGGLESIKYIMKSVSIKLCFYVSDCTKKICWTDLHGLDLQFMENIEYYLIKYNWASLLFYINKYIKKKLKKLLISNCN